MTREEAAKILVAKYECMKREISCTDLDCIYRACAECDLCYKQGTSGEQIEALEMAIKALEYPEPCEDDKRCSNCMYSGRPTYKSPCSECRDNSQWEMKPISRSHENGAECEDAVSREQVLKLFSTHNGKYLYEAIQMLPSVTLKPDHNGDTTEMVEYDDCVSRQAVIDTARKVEFIFEGEYDTRTPYGVIFDVQDAVSKLPSVTPKTEPHWIPVSDRMPKDGENCLVSVRCSNDFLVDRGTYSTDLFKVDKEDFFGNRGESGWYYLSSEYGYCKILNVIAWMPEPEPYRAERRTDELGDK